MDEAWVLFQTQKLLLSGSEKISDGFLPILNYGDLLYLRVRHTNAFSLWTQFFIGHCDMWLAAVISPPFVNYIGKSNLIKIWLLSTSKKNKKRGNWLPHFFEFW